MAFIKSCSIDSRNDWSPKYEVVHETKLTSEIFWPIHTRLVQSGRALEWWSRGHGFNHDWGQNFFFVLPCVEICQIIWQKRMSWETRMFPHVSTCIKQKMRLLVLMSFCWIRHSFISSSAEFFLRLLTCHYVHESIHLHLFLQLQSSIIHMINFLVSNMKRANFDEITSNSLQYSLTNI